MIDRAADYKQIVEGYVSDKLRQQKLQKPLPLIRLLLFIGSLIALYVLLSSRIILPGILSATLFLLFVALSVYDSKLKNKIKQLSILADINANELKVLGGDYSMFESGVEFVDPSHDYSHDLDLFGNGSVFQWLNRTATIFGKIRLANYLTNAYSYSHTLVQRQQSVKELAEKIEMRQQMRLIFHDEQLHASDKEEMQRWLESESPIKNIKLLRLLAYGIPFVTISLMLLSFFNIVIFPTYLIVLQLFIVFWYGKQTLQVQNNITSKSKILNKYAQSLLLLENAQFNSGMLLDLQKVIKPDHETSASDSIFRLSTILKYMDSNLNLLVAVILNGLFMFNLHMLLKVEKWRKSNQKHVPEWFESIAEFDALCSVSNMAFNHPEYTYPEKVEHDFILDTTDMGHPLIHHSNRVVNDLLIRGWNQFAIITGANMSGKSTFLRSVGVNFVLAMVGTPVCASKFIFYPMLVHSSIRTSDSLVKNESYFYAELKRLKQIIDELILGHKKLILLDEILKGTNSKDKQAGSVALIEQLLHYKSVGLFATHDLMLGELQARFPQQVNNLCFEIEINNDKMVIDYKLHHGVCKNLNATYLMKNMGILMK